MRGLSASWEPVVEKDSMQECKDYIRNGGLLSDDEKQSPLKFVWHPTCPGNGVTQARFICRSHKDCPVVVKAVAAGDKYWVQTLAGVPHSNEIEPRHRKNGRLTYAQVEAVRTALDTGAKPAGILSSMTSKELDRCKTANVEATKRPRGGLTGAREPQTAELRCKYANTHEYT